MISNRYKGQCICCQTQTPKEQGFFYLGHTWCTEPVPEETSPASKYGYLCERVWNQTHNDGPHKTAASIRSEQRNSREEQTKTLQTQIHQNLLNGELQTLAKQANVRSLEQVITKTLGTAIPFLSLTYSQAAQIRNELEKRINRKLQSKIHKQTNTCTRCGGVGQSDKWAYTGKTCYKCEGTGKYRP